MAAAASSDEHPPAKRQRQQLNKMDPIMLAPLPKKRHAVWRFERPGGSRVAFNVCTLADYLLATGDFLDPETRLPFSDDNLKEIDAAVAKTGCSKASVYAAAHTPNAFADLKFRRDALSGLERLAGEVVADILDVIENTEPHEAQMRLLMRELPLFGDYYSQLVQADAKYAAQCMSHWQQFISGPPNRPNADDYGLLEVRAHLPVSHFCLAFEWVKALFILIGPVLLPSLFSFPLPPHPPSPCSVCDRSWPPLEPR